MNEFNIGDPVTPNGYSTLRGVVVDTQMVGDYLLVSVEWTNDVGDKLVQTHDAFDLVKVCDHVLGVCEGRIKDNITGETLALIKSNVTASDAKWTSKNNVIQSMWVGEYYNFCPLCGEDLGKLACGVPINKFNTP